AEFNSVPETTPKLSDFTFTRQINGKRATPLKATGFNWNKHSNTAFITFKEIAAAKEEQEVVIGVTYDDVTELAETFTIAKKGAAVESIKLRNSADDSELQLGSEEDGELKLTATAWDEEGNQVSGKKVKWESDQQQVATVDQSGKVTAVGIGTATITATIDDVTESFEVTVTGEVPQIILGATSLSESAANDGSVLDMMKITLKNGTFQSTISETDVVVNELPAGLGIRVTRINDTELLLAVTGRAEQHAEKDSKQDLRVTISKSQVAGATQDVTSGPFAIMFQDVVIVTPPPAVIKPVDVTKVVTNDAGITGLAGAVAANAKVAIYEKDANPRTAKPMITILASATGSWSKETLEDGEYDLYVVSGSKYSRKATVTVTGNLLVAIQAANAALSAADNAKAAHTAAGGLETDSAYAAVVGAETTLQMTLLAEPQVKTQIVNATKELSQTVDRLVAATELIAPIAAAQHALETAAEVKAAYTTTGGAETDAEYAAVIEAGQALETALNAEPKVKIDIETKTTELTLANEALAAANDSLKAVISQANSSLGTADDALSAHIAAGGESTNLKYAAVTNAKAALQDVLAANPKVKASIQAAIDTLAQAVTALKGETELIPTIAAAQAAMDEADQAKLAHAAAGGRHTDAQYVAVVTAEGNLTLTLAADPKVKANIEAATTALINATDALKEETLSLANAIAAANAAILSAEKAKSDYGNIGGASTDSAYVAVDTAKAGLINALNAVPIVKADILSATTNLTDAINALKQETTVLDNLLTTAITELSSASQARTAYVGAGGATTDAEYVAVKNAEDALLIAKNASPKVKADLETKLADLTNAVNALKAKTELMSTLTAAQTALTAADAALTAHTDAGGTATAAEYQAVENAKTGLQTKLAATPQVKADIEAATTELVNATNALNTETLSLTNTIDAANAAILSAEKAKSDYGNIGGASTDSAYVAVDTAKAGLINALNAVPVVKADILSATTNLTDAIHALKQETTVLDNLLTSALAALASASEARTAYKGAGGATTDAEYVAVQNAEDALQIAKNASPKVKADLETKLADLTNAENVLKAKTELMSTLTAAQTALTAADAALTAHTNAGGVSAGAEYQAVESAKVGLQTALAATPQVKAEIESAMTALNNAVTALKAVTQEFEDIIGEATLAINAAANAREAYRTLGGLDTDPVYIAVQDSEDVLRVAINATPKVITYIAQTTATLNEATNALQIQTELLTTIAAATDALSAADEAKLEYTALGGEATDLKYMEVETARTALQATLDADPKVKTDMEAATTQLNNKITALVAETTALQNALLAANAALDAADVAKTAHTTIGGPVTDPEYAAVENAKSALFEARTASPLVRANIEAASTVLTTAVTALEAATKALQDALDAALQAMEPASVALVKYKAAGGAETDEKYAAVSTAMNSLQTQVDAPFEKNKAAIEAATVALYDVVAQLQAETELLEATTAANAAVTDATNAKAAYTTEGGVTSAAEYKAVIDAEANMKTALEADPKVTEDIKAATVVLVNAVSALKAITPKP
ncbi:MAG: Ig-like domain-containing protein, partial [Clostridia bacterium]